MVVVVAVAPHPLTGSAVVAAVAVRTRSGYFGHQNFHHRLRSPLVLADLRALHHPQTTRVEAMAVLVALQHLILRSHIYPPPVALVEMVELTQQTGHVALVVGYSEQVLAGHPHLERQPILRANLVDQFETLHPGPARRQAGAGPLVVLPLQPRLVAQADFHLLVALAVVLAEA